MLEAVHAQASERKLRQFAAACCAQLAEYLSCVEHEHVVEEAWRFAEGSAAGTGRLLDALVEGNCCQEADTLLGSSCRDIARGLARTAAPTAARHAAEITVWAVAESTYREQDRQESVMKTKRLLCDVLRCLFGDSFRPRGLDLCWRMADAVALARAAYEHGSLRSGTLDHGRLAVLSDALEEAGCTEAGLLDHLRGPRPHYRGCWAVGLVLDKE